MIKLFYSITLVAFFSCAQQETSKITAEQLKNLQNEGVTVVDVRTEKEYAAGHIPGVSNNINFYGDDFLQQMDSFDKSQPIIIYCAKGGRSGNAAQQLTGAGFVKVYDYTGGFTDWKAKGETIEK